MLVETTVEKMLESVIKGEGKITDNSVCGKCSKCGECCTNLLPISQEELETIQKYVIENKIRPQSHLLVMQNRLCCPYYDGKKCLIYEVRPLICREFYCYKKSSYKTGEKFLKDKYITVDMWGIAKEIDKYFRRKQ